MTPKEKAEELVYKCDETLEFSTPQRFARKCALVAVDEILNIDAGDSVNKNYWQEVKQEIENL
jgi:hypothetical protein